MSQFKKPTKEELKQKLDNLQYEVTQKEATEPPFKNKYWDNHETGLYVDIVTGEPLFTSKDKFDSGTGWPCFSQPLNKSSLVFKEDHKMWAARTEVRSQLGDSHLGHVFNDGPSEKGGSRYCINSASLKFIPLNELKNDPVYKEWLKIFEEA
jgi:methionine-R-sulfoxide reductase